PHPGHRVDDAVDRLVGLAAVRNRDHAHAFALRRLREDQREAAVAGDEADGLGHGAGSGYGLRTHISISRKGSASIPLRPRILGTVLRFPVGPYPGRWENGAPR